jgi:hypothetical protein
MIFQDYISGMGGEKIAKKLREQGVHAFSEEAGVTSASLKLSKMKSTPETPSYKRSSSSTILPKRKYVTKGSSSSISLKVRTRQL